MSLLQELHKISKDYTFLNEKDEENSNTILVSQIISYDQWEQELNEKALSNIHSLCRKIHVNKKVYRSYDKSWSPIVEQGLLTFNETMALSAYLLHHHIKQSRNKGLSLKCLNASLFLIELTEKSNTQEKNKLALLCSQALNSYIGLTLAKS